MRSSIALGLALVWLVGLVGCGGDDSSEVASADGDVAPAAEGGPGMAGPEPGMGGPGGEGDGSSEGGSGMGSGMDPGMEGDMSSDGGSGMGPGMDPGMEGDMSGEEGDMAGMEGDMAGMEGDMAGMEGDMAGMEGDMEPGMEGEMAGMEGDMLSGGGSGTRAGMEPGMEGDMEGMEGDMSSEGQPGMDPGMEGDMSGGGGSAMGPGMGGPGQGRGPGSGQAKQPQTFADMAERAFQQGRDKEAFQYLFAHAVTADDAAARELLGKMGWIGPPKRPGLAVRWGVGIEFSSRGYDGDIYPIGKNQKMPEKGGGAGGAGGGGIGFGAMDAGGQGAGMQGGGGGQVNARLQQYTGELGQRLVEELQNRAARGDYGEVLKSANAAGTQRQGGGGMNQGGPGMGMEMGGSGDEFDGQGPGGGFGAGRAGRRAGSKDSVTQLFPGAVLLGPASSKEMLKLAKQAELDVLCVFNVSVAVVRRTQQISTTYKIQLYNVADGKDTYKMKKTLNNIAVQVARANENTRGGDPVDEAMEKLFEHIDGNWRIAPLPTLQQEHALGRIGVLLGETHENPLPVLAEIRMYHTRGLIQDNHLLLAYQRKLGNDQFGTELATGTEEEKKQVIAEWLR